MKKQVFHVLTTAATVAGLFFFATFSDVVSAAGATGSGNTGSGNTVVNPSPEAWYTDGIIETDTLPEGVKQETITREAYDLGVKAGNSDAAKRQVEEKLAGWTIDGVVSVFDLVVEKGGQVAVRMPALTDKDNYTYAALHYSDWGFSGYPEVIKMTLADWTNNKWTFNVTSGSPYVFVKLRKVVATNTDNGQTEQPAAAQPGTSQTTTAEGAPVSPKTGEVLPVATGIVLLCLAGVAACAKRACCKD